MQIRLDYLLKSLQSGFCGTAIYHFSIIPVTLNKTHYHALISKGIQRLSHLNESGDLQQKQTCNETTLEPRHQLFWKWCTWYKDEGNAWFGCPPRRMLRCDDCIKYHPGKCCEIGITTAQVCEIFAVANIVGGTIVIPQTRRAAGYWE